MAVAAAAATVARKEATMANSKDIKDKAGEARAAEGAASGRTAGRQLTPEEARALLDGSDRTHFEGLGMQWIVLLGSDPRKLMSQVVATVLQAGGTRPAWRWTTKGTEFVLMAWPKDEPVRAAVLMAGDEGGKLRPVDSFPLIQGLPNDLVVDQVHPWESGSCANVAALMEEGRNPMWFFDPLYEREADDLTPGVTHTFILAGLAFSVRKALLDEISITRGPNFEAHAKQWLEANPGKGRLDVPPLRINMRGHYLIMPGRQFCEYEMRAKIERIDETKLDKMEVKILYLNFPFEHRASMMLPVYASRVVLKDYEPKVGDEIDAYVWLQGHIIDMDEQAQNAQEAAARAEANAASGQNLGVVPEHRNPLEGQK